MAAVDTALIIAGVVETVWRNKTVQEVLAKQGDVEGELLAFAAADGPDAAEVTPGQLWDGEVLTNPPSPPAPPRRVGTSTIVDRLTVAGKAAAFMAALSADPAFMLRWISERSGFLDDDAQLLAALNDIGANPAEILAA